MSGLSLYILETHKLIRTLWRPSQFRGSLKTQNEDVKNQTVVLSDETGELKTSDQTIGVGVRHVLERDDHVVLGGHVVSQVVVNNQSEQLVQECEIDLVVEFFKLSLH